MHLPGHYSDMTRCALSGDVKKARAIDRSTQHIHMLLYAEGNPAGIKAALGIMGLCRPEVRLPLTSMSKDGTAQLHDVLRQVNDL